MNETLEGSQMNEVVLWRPAVTSHVDSPVSEDAQSAVPEPTWTRAERQRLFRLFSLGCTNHFENIGSMSQKRNSTLNLQIIWYYAIIILLCLCWGYMLFLFDRRINGLRSQNPRSADILYLTLQVKGFRFVCHNENKMDGTIFFQTKNNVTKIYKTAKRC